MAVNIQQCGSALLQVHSLFPPCLPPPRLHCYAGYTLLLCSSLKPIGLEKAIQNYNQLSRSWSYLVSKWSQRNYKPLQPALGQYNTTCKGRDTLEDIFQREKQMSLYILYLTQVKIWNLIIIKILWSLILRILQDSYTILLSFLSGLLTTKTLHAIYCSARDLGSIPACLRRK